MLEYLGGSNAFDKIIEQFKAIDTDPDSTPAEKKAKTDALARENFKIVDKKSDKKAYTIKKSRLGRLKNTMEKKTISPELAAALMKNYSKNEAAKKKEMLQTILTTQDDRADISREDLQKLIITKMEKELEKKIKNDHPKDPLLDDGDFKLNEKSDIEYINDAKLRISTEMRRLMEGEDKYRYKDPTAVRDRAEKMLRMNFNSNTDNQPKKLYEKLNAIDREKLFEKLKPKMSKLAAVVNSCQQFTYTLDEARKIIKQHGGEFSSRDLFLFFWMAFYKSFNQKNIFSL